MYRYFFHIEDGQPLWDTEGQLHPDDQAAYMTALRKAPDLLSASIERGGHPSEDWRLEILDDTGRLVGTLRFQASRAT